MYISFISPLSDMLMLVEQLETYKTAWWAAPAVCRKRCIALAKANMVKTISFGVTFLSAVSLLFTVLSTILLLAFRREEEIVWLTEGDGTHTIEWSPDRTYYLDTYSRMDMPPVHELRRTKDGALITTLEKADWAPLLETGWQQHPPPRPC